MTAQIATGIATTLIALFVAIIAFLQWRLNEANLREKLFERRYQVFVETQGFLAELMKHARIELALLGPFTDTCQRARFLFDSRMHGYLTAIRSHAADMLMHQGFMQGDLSPAAKAQRTKDFHAELKWLVGQLDTLAARFEPYLGFSKHR